MKKKYPPQYDPSQSREMRLLYAKWGSMKARCNGYWRYKERYFDRGIAVCEEWSYWPNFAKWAMENGYDTKLELDRRDNDKGYSPDNCRFITQAENTRNRDNANMRKSIRLAKTKKMAKPFVCHKSNQIFLTEISASRILGIDRRGIGRVLKKIHKQVKGFTFEYIMIPLSMYDELLTQEDAHLTGAYELR